MGHKPLLLTSNLNKTMLLMRLWQFSSSVNSFFKRACAAIQWSMMSRLSFAGRLCGKYQNLMCWLKQSLVCAYLFPKVRVFQFKNVFVGSCNRNQSKGWHVDVVMQRSIPGRRLCLLYLTKCDIATTPMHAKWITNLHCICQFYCRWDGFGLTFIRNSWVAKKSNRIKTMLCSYWITITLAVSVFADLILSTHFMFQ